MLNTNELIATARQYKRWMNLSHSLTYASRPTVLKHLSKNEFNSARLLMIENSHDLLCFVGHIPIAPFEEILNEPNYTLYTLHKKNGGLRTIQIPEPRLKQIQRKINNSLQHYYLLTGSDVAFGFVKKKGGNPFCSGIARNAAKHAGQNVVLNLDLKDFFDSISAARIYRVFKSPLFQFSEEIATTLALLCTYERKLPTGAPTSPILSNFVCLQLDHELQEFASQNKLNYSRYADDLTFSSNERITDEMKSKLKEIIQSHRFEINPKKWRIRTKNQKQLVTGLVVNQKVNVDRKLIRKVRAMIHDLNANGIERATAKHFKNYLPGNLALQDKFIHRLTGYIDFIGQVRGREDGVYISLQKKKLALGYR